MEIDKIYIEEAIRIRKVYIENLSKINDIFPHYEKLLSDFEKVKEELDDIDDDSDDVRHNEDFYKGKLEYLNDKITETSIAIKPFSDNIHKLDEDQRVLFNQIKDKYPTITYEEIEQAILPHIINIL